MLDLILARINRFNDNRYNSPHTYDKKIGQRDQASGVEKTWANTGGARSGRGYRKNITWWPHAEALAVQPRDTAAAQ